MIIRNPVAAGSFYPRNSSDLRSVVAGFCKESGEEKKSGIKGIVSPHAGYVYCGSVQSKVFSSIDSNKTFVIIGPNHTGVGAPASIMTEGIWKTPLGMCRINKELAFDILEKSKFLENDFHAHAQEHSIEVQLPWLQYLFSSVSFVPICLGHLNSKAFSDIGNAIRDSLPEDSVVVASSDFTHFGDAYGYKPVKGGPGSVLPYIKKIDMEAAKAVTELAPERLVETVSRYRATICGSSAIATMLYSIKDKAKEGNILEYTTSYEKSRNLDALVGYCGIILA